MQRGEAKTMTAGPKTTKFDMEHKWHRKDKRDKHFAIDVSLWREVKAESARRGITISELVSDLLRKELGYNYNYPASRTLSRNRSR